MSDLKQYKTNTVPGKRDVSIRLRMHRPSLLEMLKKSPTIQWAWDGNTTLIKIISVGLGDDGKINATGETDGEEIRMVFE